MSTRSKPRTAADYMVACICPMGVELAPFEAMLDKIHDPLPINRIHNSYTLGEIGGHNIVVAVMPLTGTNAAATVATQLLNDFPLIRFGLLVGIGGGVPGLKDVRLGDVVVSQTSGRYPGVVQYDLGKSLDGRFERTGSLNRPPAVLSASVQRLDSQYRRQGHRLSAYISQMIQRYPQMEDEYSLPVTANDCLFLASYSHQPGFECANCDPHQTVQRSRRPRNEPYIHYGTIGSANIVVKDALLRDTLSQEMAIVCLEMEAAGLMNDFPCLVIRGICDYADSHKNKQWQPYAAAVAAAYMKELLLTIPTVQVTQTQVAIASSASASSLNSAGQHSHSARIGPQINDQSTARTQNLYFATDNEATSADQVRRDKDTMVDEDLLGSLAFPQMLDRQLSVQPPHPDTCRWILELDRYRAWSSQPYGLLWIKGKPGSGKSTLMSFLYTQLYQRIPTPAGNSARLEFFFSARGVYLQRSTIGMLRSLLCQLLRQSHDSRVIVRRYYQNKCSAFGGQKHIWEWQQRELETLLLETVIAAAGSQQVSLFVDALDEAGESAARTIAEYFHIMNTRVATTSASVKICISCRHYPIISVGYGTEVCMEDHNRDDIAVYVKDRLNATISHMGLDESQVTLCDSLTTDLICRSQGVFQWVCIVTGNIEQSVAEGMPLSELRDRLSALPTEIGDVYETIFSKIADSHHRFHSFLLFQWVYLAERPLSVEELRYALAAHDASPRSRLSMTTVKCHETNSFVETDENMKRRMRALSGGLLEVVDERVQVGHQTIKEFLLQRGLVLLEQKSVDQPGLDPALIMERCHATLSWSCLTYMATEAEMVTENGYRGLRYLLRQKLRSNLPFASYAAENVFVHAEKARRLHQQSVPDQIAIMERVVTFWAIMNGNFGLRHGITVLHIAAGAALDGVVVCLLERGHNVNVRTQFGRTALHYAAERGHERMLRLLISAGAELVVTKSTEPTPLALAAANGHLSSVRILLKRANDSKTQIDGIKGALLAAVRTNQEQAVWIMLDMGVDANAEDASGSVIRHASLIGNERIVQMLLDSGADVNAGGSCYNTALEAASSEGHERIVQILLDAGADVNAGEYCGTALQAASSRGHERIVQMLLDAGADTNAGWEELGTALQTVSLMGNERLVQMLLDAGADVNVRGGRYGTALWAASSRGHERIVQILLDAGVDANVEGGYHGTALQAASLGGHERIVQILLDAGADVNAGEYCGTALQAASSRGHERIVQMLLNVGADADVEGGYYGTSVDSDIQHSDT